MGMMHGIRVELGLEADARPADIGGTPLAGLILDKIAGVDLNAGQIGIYIHDKACPVTGEGGNFGEFTAVIQAPVVVVAHAEIQSLIILFDVPAHGLGDPEVHGRARYGQQLAGGDGNRIRPGEAVGIQPYGVLKNIAGIVAV